MANSTKKMADYSEKWPILPNRLEKSATLKSPVIASRLSCVFRRKKNENG
jgi:hypothetical protein